MRAENDQDGGGSHPRSIASIRRANTSDSATVAGWDDLVQHPTSIGKLCPTESSASKINLLFCWRAILGDEVIRGEHHLRALSLRPESKIKGCPIHVTASYPSVVSHDFTAGPAVLPVKVTLQNQLLKSPVSFSLVSKSHPSFELIGLGKLQSSLQPDSSMEVPFDVLIPKEGIHNIQSLQIKVRHSGADLEEIILYDLSQQWLLHVSDSGTSRSR